jgi:hypothetical protein
MSAFIGLRKNTWDEKARGWRRLTLTGWIVCVLAIGSFSLAFSNTYRSHKQSAEASRKEQLLRTQAGQEILEALNHFLIPLKQIYDTAEPPPKDQAQLESYVISRHMKDASDDLDEYAKDAFIARLHNMPANTNPFPYDHDPSLRLDRIVSGYSGAFEGRLASLLSTYQNVVDADTAALMDEARNHKMLSIFRAAASNVERNRELGKDVDKIDLGWLLFGPHEPNELYIPFLHTLKNLREHAAALIRKRPDKETLFTSNGPKH